MMRLACLTGGQLKRLPSGYAWRLWRLQLANSTVSMLLAVTLLIAGCSSPFGAHTAPAPSPSKSATSLDASIPTVTMQQAWGDIQPLQIPTALPDGRVFVWESAATGDGQWLVGESELHDFLDNTTQPEFLVLYNVTTREVRTLHQLLHPQSQILGVSLDGEWLAWSEADDQPNFFDWTLSVYNLRTGQSHELAQTVREGGKPVPGPAPFPAVSAGHLIWGQAVAPVSAAAIDNAVVKLADLTSGRVTTLATRAGNPELAWPWATWGQVGAASGEGYEQIVNLETGETHRLNAKPASLSMAGT
ncbi:MAG: hypothetical protein ACXWQZ_14425, partial [Ktedonobacterales bacterium]